MSKTASDVDFMVALTTVYLSLKSDILMHICWALVFSLLENFSAVESAYKTITSEKDLGLTLQHE